ncbi:MAG: SLC13 family permease [Candidatus Marinimicrobia bacterium]|jgi:di/tricarboxylate transporter|nr:SLC13 family permease [Candidatus Neomarinimicrobiota bacterium]MDP6261179.1 SLC13 family permease [Candidatus Neomarinimicrobiota bacterium]MDP7127237.1 SLC13 family permease [Candidatus Neomarinimicrobiota bacterium]MDP7337293.1 SLC13 family permease [Candidatus Neomarinimicrobiota bacterium]MDP7474756.1 SLC13 family permease [Candidatus Neomarinimicrobiota bacterium]|tara:strand:+ start:24265 stop:26076 length:1812 start_codon:yes stop_codon:yes gene_type:complete
MTPEIAIVLGVITLMFILFVTELLPLDVTALSILAIVLVLGYISPEEAISGFANPAVITIALLFVLSHSLQKSGILEYMIIRLNKLTERSRFLGLFVFLISVALASAFVNNTAIVAIFIPLTIRLAQKYNLSPSKLLMPLSYIAIIGGTLTLVGTSTNLLVNSIYVNTISSSPPLGMFEFAKFGLVMLVIGMAYLLIAVPFLIPSRTVTSSLTKSYHMGGYLTELKVSEESPLVGRTCKERAVNKNYDITVLDILRDGKLISKNIRDTIIYPEDILFVRGSLENFLRMKEVEKVTMLTDEKLTQDELIHDDNTLVECLITNQTDLVGKSLMEINFRRRFGSFILAIRREGEILRKKIAHVVLQAFDTLLIYGPIEKIKELSDSGDFIVLGEIEATLQKHKYWWVSVAVIFGAVILAALGIVPILKGALVGAIFLLVIRVVTANEAYQSINWQVIVLIAALIPLGIVIQKSGTAFWIGTVLNDIANAFNPLIRPTIMLSLVYLVTIILTEMTSNAATAIIMTPIAISAAQQMGLEPRTFVFAVCFAASASFITPIGYQTNLMVYGPGGYKFTDYVRVGLPLAIVLWCMATWLIPILWPFASINV